ncbi:cation-translocating P-type ATPase [Cryobacterium luteum]|uniref:Cation-transporting P-type ATPase n=1 Tax=Cryobacterium luteum TaxID=1424661 RepID=A0A1H8IEE6_9MICO|nr:cation-transporting P-type ATPase [Cryobacterium luteum]TFB95523.1 cation-transporting P-type ATPase [Cryobacterium luteum]SEN67210.1 Ca2+-transporting ATPase [Cryobacterium luteum]
MQESTAAHGDNASPPSTDQVVAAIAAGDAYRDTEPDVLARFETRRTGLTDAEVARHRALFGDNVIVQVQQESMLLRYLHQFKDWMIVLLLACAAITGYLGDTLTSAVLVLLVLLNTSIGFVQEYRAGKTMDALQHLAQSLTQVLRENVFGQVDSAELVVGDVVRLEEGAAVPADIRLIEATAFSTNEFALTGESDPTRKYTHAIMTEVAVAERHNTAHAGTTVATGEAIGVVVATGTHTELGRIARLTQSAPRTVSPLQREMGYLARNITYVAVALALVLLVVAVQADLPFHAALLFAVGFASAVIPQGLPAEVNTALAQAAGALAQRQALVKRLSAVETLGATEVICTDKTGTLTKNEMTVTELVVAGRDYVVTGIGYAPEGSIEPAGAASADRVRLTAFLRTGLLASNARLLAPDDSHAGWHILGDPTEGALVTVAAKAGVDLAATDREVREFPFDSARKLMTSIRESPEGSLVAHVKGAPESIVQRCSHIDDGGTLRPITDADREAFLDRHAEKSDRCLRNLAFATRTVTPADAAAVDPQAVERDLVLLGLVSMVDPIRESVPGAMRTALDARIRVNIITGDFSRTAEAIARQAGLDSTDQLTVVTADALRSMPDDQVLAHALKGYTVFSRVDPEDKTRIVDLVKKSGHVVAVTGDGINDAPALRHASIGVAMGASGTDVAKEAAEVVLLDDSFSTLVGAIEKGRVIYANIAKGVLACLTSNVAELVVNIVSLLLATIAGVPLALNVLQILAIDLLGELLPIAALGKDPESGRIMTRGPRDPKAHIVNRRSILDVVYAGSLIGLLAIGNYLLFYSRAGVNPFDGPLAAAIVAQATTMTYVTILVCQLVNIVQRRSELGAFSRYQFSNPTFWLACAFGVAVMLAIVYVPFVNVLFSTGPLGFTDWGFVLLSALIYLTVREAGRLLRSRRHQVA